MERDIKEYLDQASIVTQSAKVMARDIAKSAQACIETIARGNKIIWCGNGGSAADAQHMAAELMGKYKKDRAPLPSISLTVDTSAITAIGNDYGFEHVFSRQLMGIGDAGDLLMCISTSGNSANIVEAVKTATDMGITTVALTGDTGGRIADMVNILLNVPSTETNHIQEVHLKIEHMICGFIEDAFADIGRPESAGNLVAQARNTIKVA